MNERLASIAQFDILNKMEFYLATMFTDTTISQKSSFSKSEWPSRIFSEQNVLYDISKKEKLVAQVLKMIYDRITVTGDNLRVNT